MAGKINNMVATVPKRGRGRPPKYEGGGKQRFVTLPADLDAAAEIVRAERKLTDFSDALREMIRESAEARGLVEPRK